MNGKSTILVTSCDAYRDVEVPFLILFRRYWPDCPYELVLLTETDAGQAKCGGGVLAASCAPSADGSAGHLRFDRVIATGRGLTWSQMLVAALDEIRTPTVMMLMNDYLLESKVDTADIVRRVDEAIANRALNLRLEPSPPGDEAYAPGLRRKRVNTAYAISCKTGLWDRDFLRGLAARTKSAWEFERRGSFLFDEGEERPLLVTERREFPFCDAVHKGCWEKAGAELLRREGIDYDFSRRGLPGVGRRLIEGAKDLIFKVFPLTWIVRVQNLTGAGWK